MCEGFVFGIMGSGLHCSAGVCNGARLLYVASILQVDSNPYIKSSNLTLRPKPTKA